MQNILTGSWKPEAGSFAQRGVTLIDTVVGTSLMLLVFVGIFAAFQLSVDVVTNNRARAGALALMNERMEYVRSLDYASVGTVGGIPSGPIAQSESVTLSDVPYTRRTTIQYTDDPEDGENESDENDVIVDYKQVRIEVSWSSRTGERRVLMVARVEPLNGEEVDCGTPCGTLRIDVLNAVGGPVQGAQVDIVNSSIVPAIDITTYTNVNGRVILAGAPVASGYEVTVSKFGYNSAQTYPSDPENNPNPTPAHAGVLQNQTKTVTFGLPDSGIDQLSAKTIYTFSAIDYETWDEPFAGTSKIASSTDIAVSGGSAALAGLGTYAEWGELESVAIGHAYLAQWREFSWSGSTPAGTSVAFRFLDGNRALISDAVLPGNAQGFTSSPVDLYGVSTSTYPSIIVRATLTGDTEVTPAVYSYSVLYDFGPVPLPNARFDMRGEKRIGTDPAVYKYDEEGLQSNAQGALQLQNMEWDTYAITIPASTGYGLAHACAPQPEYLAPGTSQSTYLYLTQSTNALTIAVSGGSGEFVPGATVAISGSLYAATSTTGSCGRAFFSDTPAGNYAYRVTAPGYAATSAAVSVAGLTEQPVELTPQ